MVKKIINFKNYDVNKKDKHGVTGLHMAVKRENKYIVEAFLNLKNIDVNCVDRFGNTALMHAVRTRRVDIITMLLSRLDIDSNQTNDSGEILVHIAVLCKNIDSLHILLKQDIDVNKADGHGSTPLHYSAYIGFEAGVIALLNHPKINVDVRDRDGLTPQLKAVKQAHHRIARLFENKNGR